MISNTPQYFQQELTPSSIFSSCNMAISTPSSTSFDPIPNSIISKFQNPFSKFTFLKSPPPISLNHRFLIRAQKEELAASQGIRIRRRPPTGPAQHYVGPFQFRLQNEGNTPRNILEEIVWNKDVEVAQCPLLCKEFVVDAWQIYKARTKGADAILLIAAILPDLDIKYMTKICKLVGLTALVEVHDEREMDRVLEIDGVELIGINNRSLETFEVDIGNTKKLLQGERGDKIRQKDIIVVGESGLFTPADIAFVQEAGVKAVLVGESIVKKKDPAKGIAELYGKDISV